jgi:hypothetical protein
MASNARNLANLLGTGQSTISAEKLGSDVPPGIEDYSSVDSLGVGTTIGETAFVEGSNRLYIWNGSGWYNIALINTTPTWDSGGQPAASYELDADSPQGSVIVTLSASDPEGIPITYSYIQSGQMDSMATISQDSSVFTITPKTISEVGEGVSLTGNITFRASDGINILPQVSSFTLNFISIIGNSRYTTLLATVTGTSDNNNITDASSNNHSITVNGDAHAGTFSPYRSGGYSIYLPAINGGSEHNISFDHDTGFNFGSGDFTIEFSIYFPSATTGTDYLFQHGESTGSWNINTYNGYVFLFLNGISIGQDIIGDSGYAISSHLNEWINYAIVRSGSTVTMYRNGTSVATKTSAQNANVGATLDTTNSEYLHINRRRSGIGDGTEFYFKDFRVTKGLARTISANTEPLTSDANTSILVGSLPYIGDASSYNQTPTFIGNPSTKPFSPYDYNEYDAADHGGSVHFDGTGDYLEVANSTDFILGTGNFTVECWVYFNTLQVCNIADNRGNGDGFSLQLTGSNYLGIWDETTGTQLHISNSIMTINKWCHICYQRSSTTSKYYINGVQQGSDVTHSGNFTSNSMVFGSRWSKDMQYFDGFLSNFRLIKGTAVYNSIFTPPTTPVTDITNTKLIVNGTDASIIDKSQSRNIKITSNITSTTQTKFANTRSIYFDGSTSVNLNETLIFPTTNTPFTGELWFYPTNVAGAGRIIGQADSSNSGRLSLNLETDGRIRLYWNGANNLYSTNSISDNQWHHIAFVRKNNGYLAVYVNGTETELAQDNNNRSVDGSPTRIGSQGPSYFPSYIQGYIQDLRITNGLARYTANFTPPSAPLEG